MFRMDASDPAGPSRPPRSVDDLLRQYAAYQIVHVHYHPTYVAKRDEILVAIHGQYGDAGLFICDPGAVARHLYRSRRESGRKAQTCRRAAATVEDFREWCTTVSNRGEIR